MYEIIGFLFVCVVGVFACFAVPIFVGMVISDRRRDDGLALYASIPIAIICGGISAVALLVYLFSTV